MLWRLIRPRLAPHLSAIVVIVVLQLASTIASLYLPNLNGDIIVAIITLMRICMR